MCDKRILTIDDEAPMRYLLERQLCRSGYVVIEAADGFCRRVGGPNPLA